MRVALFGATGFIGSAVLDELLAQGHEVTALVRTQGTVPAKPALSVIEGSVADKGAVAQVVSGSAAVVSCLGTRRSDKQPVDFLASATRAIIEQMKIAHVERLIAISGAGIRVPGERKPFPHNAISALVGLVAADLVAAKQLEFDVLQENTEIAWTAVRPTRVVEGSATSGARSGVEIAGMGMRVTRGDLARFIVAQITDDTYVRRSPFVSS